MAWPRSCCFLKHYQMSPRFEGVLATCSANCTACASYFKAHKACAHMVYITSSVIVQYTSGFDLFHMLMGAWFPGCLLALSKQNLPYQVHSCVVKPPSWKMGLPPLFVQAATTQQQTVGCGSGGLRWQILNPRVCGSVSSANCIRWSVRKIFHSMLCLFTQLW